MGSHFALKLEVAKFSKMLTTQHTLCSAIMQKPDQQ